MGGTLDITFAESQLDVPLEWKETYENAEDWAVMRPFEALSQPSVRLVYFLPKDRSVRSNRAAALCQLITESQEFYADEMERHGFGGKTFRVETDVDGVPVIHFIQGQFEEDYYYQRLSDYKIWDEVFEHVKDPRHIYFIVIDLSHELLDDGRSCGLGGVTFIPSSGHSVFSFGSIAIRHRDETVGERVLGGSLIIPASGHCFFYDVYKRLHELRVSVHELGHAFGLEHDFRVDDLLPRGSDNMAAIGGSGYFLSRCDAEWLSVSRFFNEGLFEGSPGNIELLSAPKRTPEGIQLRFRVSDPDGLHQAQLLVPENYETSSWGPYRIFDCKQLRGCTDTVVFVSSALAEESVDRITLQIIDLTGGITWATIPVDW